MEFELFFAVLLRNAPLLLVLLPVIGAGLVLATLPMGGLAARRTSQANALVTMALGIAMAVHYVNVVAPQRAGRIATTRSRDWMTSRPTAPRESDAAKSGDAVDEPSVVGPPVRVVFGVDGLNLWFAVLTTFAMFPVLQLASADDRDGPAYVLLLLYEACLLGAFLAMDALLLCVFTETAVVLAFPLIGVWGGYERRPAALRWLTFQLVAGTLVLAGMVLVVVARRWALADGSEPPTVTFSLVELVAPSGTARARIEQHPLWVGYAPWAFGALLTGCAIRSAWIPAHTWLVPVTMQSPPAFALLLAAGGAKIGLYVMLRVVLPIFPAESAAVAPTMVALGVVGVLFGALLTLAQGNLSKFVSCATLTYAAAGLAAAFDRSVEGVTGSILLAIHHGCSAGLLTYVVLLLGERYDTYDVEAFGGLARRYPRLAILFGFALFTLLGVPGGSGFVAGLMVAAGVYSTSGILLALLFAGGLLTAWALLWTSGRLFGGRFREPVMGDPGAGREPRTEADTVLDLGWFECAAAVPLVVGVLWIGLWPSSVVDSISASSVRILESHDDSRTTGNEATRSSKLNDSESVHPPEGGS